MKTKKKPEYIPMLMAKIMRLQNEHVGLVARYVSLNESDPALIAPNIAAKPAPLSKELFLQRKSHFTKTDASCFSSPSEVSDDTLVGEDTELVS